ncbi:DUF4384 domain-containing protein [Roseovarius sp. E0-M6]|uniref:DUF4384 domain-containing protein n=1 Tax=Roseovarius sp. E0-M6 TaxID=3127118 RepID=UPI00300FA456
MFKTFKITAAAVLLASAAPVWAEMSDMGAFRALSAVEVAETPVTAQIKPIEVADVDSAAKGVLKKGDRIAFEIEGVEGAKVYILNMDSAGTIQMIYPNKFATGEGAQEEATMMVPSEGAKYEFEVSGDGGTEMVKVIAIDGDSSAYDAMIAALFDEKSAFPRALEPAEKTVKSLEDVFAAGSAQIRAATLEYVVAK